MFVWNMKNFDFSSCATFCSILVDIPSKQQNSTRAYSAHRQLLIRPWNLVWMAQPRLFQAFAIIVAVSLFQYLFPEEYSMKSIEARFLSPQD